MTPRLDLKDFLSMMLENACLDFQKTPEYQINQMKQEGMDELCKTMFRDEEREFAEECFDIIYEMTSVENEFTYRQGMRDCVRLLRALEIIR